LADGADTEDLDPELRVVRTDDSRFVLADEAV
jgi:hypothetical protein